MVEQNKRTAVQVVGGFFKAVGNFFTEFGTAVVKGDLFGKIVTAVAWGGLCPPQAVCKSSAYDNTSSGNNYFS